MQADRSSKQAGPPEPIGGHPGHPASQNKLGDFTTSWHVIPLWLVAVGIGVLSAFVALGLLRLIGLFTNLFFYGRWSGALVSPVGHHLGAWVVVVPVIGGLIIGFMARYGSERIRGHGIPEALESILISGSRVEPRVAILKPISAALSIGSGGPFGAEGPIIMTGGAFGSMVAQFIRLTSAERKTLLVAGAAGGMSATFASPVSAVLLAVELLLFEWKPRSMIPIGLASAAAAVIRRYIIGIGPLFPTPPTSPVHRPQRNPQRGTGRRACRRSLGLAHRLGLCRRRLLWKAPHPLDVVACDWRRCDRNWRLDLSPSSGRGL